MAVILLLTSLCYLWIQTRSALIFNSSFHVLTATTMNKRARRSEGSDRAASRLSPRDVVTGRADTPGLSRQTGYSCHARPRDGRRTLKKRWAQRRSTDQKIEKITSPADDVASSSASSSCSTSSICSSTTSFGTRIVSLLISDRALPHRPVATVNATVVNLRTGLSAHCSRRLCVTVTVVHTTTLAGPVSPRGQCGTG